MRNYKGVEITDAMVGRFLRDLHDFGYPSLTFAELRKACDDAIAGVEPTDVIGIIVKQQIDDAIDSAASK